MSGGADANASAPLFCSEKRLSALTMKADSLICLFVPKTFGTFFYFRYCNKKVD